MITKHIGAFIPNKLKDVPKKQNLDNLTLYATKGYVQISTMENHELRKQVVETIIPKLVVKTMKILDVFLILDGCVTSITSFDLWMFEFK
jgi:hypothetical protein